MGLISRIKTWTAGETLTAAQLNAEFNNILDNLDPTGIDDESADDSAAQATSDPYASSSLVKATSLETEIQQLRYLIAQITGETYWYIDPDSSIATLHPLTASVAALNTFLASLDLTNHAVLVGSGSSPVTPLAAMTNGQLVVGATGADPAPQTVGTDATLAANGALTLASNIKIKGWIQFNGTGEIAIQDHYNVNSITDEGTGDYTVTWETDFANDDYAVVASGSNTSGWVGIAALAVGTTRLTYNHYDNHAATDIAIITVIAIGDQ